MADSASVDKSVVIVTRWARSWFVESLHVEIGVETLVCECGTDNIDLMLVNFVLL
jgi:hypothetical protein